MVAAVEVALTAQEVVAQAALLPLWVMEDREGRVTRMAIRAEAAEGRSTEVMGVAVSEEMDLCA